MWYMEKSDFLGELPAYYREIKQVCILGDCNDGVVDEMKAKIRELVDGYFVVSDCEYTLEQYEKIFLGEKQKGSTLAKRKNEVLASFKNRPPINEYRVVEVCKTFLGDGSSVRMDIDSEKFICYAKYKADMAVARESELFKKLREMIPANMEIMIAFDYCEWRELLSKCWKDLSALSWQQVKNGE